jgi:hypothetical protein
VCTRLCWKEAGLRSEPKRRVAEKEGTRESQDLAEKPKESQVSAEKPVKRAKMSTSGQE